LLLKKSARTEEEWSEVDNLADGRVGVAFASGWHPDNFALAPDVYTQRRETMFRDIQLIKHLWKGERVPVRNGEGEEIDVRI
jgi:alkanesulfonate monooxygenase SsuD/methylene tetrahydromethanopterin reductase-like flavin-dependent oxidoreductase (luciferase family)